MFWALYFNSPTSQSHSSKNNNVICHGAGSHIEFLVVELSELAEHCGRLVRVLGHSTRQSFGAGRTDGLLVVCDVSNQQGAELRDQLQVQRLPEPVDGGQAKKKKKFKHLLNDIFCI